MNKQKRILKIGVLAVQGSFSEHISALKKVSDNSEEYSITTLEIRGKEDILDDMRGLIIPGGESTTLSVFFSDAEFYERLKTWMQRKRNVVWGTCMGMILLANNVRDQSEGGQMNFGGMDITVSRNHYGRQYNSFEKRLNVCESEMGKKDFHGIFIRAPGVASVNDPKGVTVIADFEENNKKEIVAVRQGRLMACSFHPELTDDLTFHKYFIKVIADSY